MIPFAFLFPQPFLQIHINPPPPAYVTAYPVPAPEAWRSKALFAASDFIGCVQVVAPSGEAGIKTPTVPVVVLENYGGIAPDTLPTKPVRNAFVPDDYPRYLTQRGNYLVFAARDINSGAWRVLAAFQTEYQIERETNETSVRYADDWSWIKTNDLAKKVKNIVRREAGAEADQRFLDVVLTYQSVVAKRQRKKEDMVDQRIEELKREFAVLPVGTTRARFESHFHPDGGLQSGNTRYYEEPGILFEVQYSHDALTKLLLSHPTEQVSTNRLWFGAPDDIVIEVKNIRYGYFSFD